MNIFLEQHQQLLKSLLEEKVEFLVVGGYAVIFHGYPRATGDMDIWIKPDNSVKPSFFSALRKLGIDECSINEIEKLDFTKHLMFSTGSEPEKVDFLTRITGVEFDEAQKQKIIAEFDGLKVPFIHLHHLILSKISNNRPKDKADVHALQNVSKYRKNI